MQFPLTTVAALLASLSLASADVTSIVGNQCGTAGAFYSKGVSGCRDGSTPRTSSPTTTAAAAAGSSSSSCPSDGIMIGGRPVCGTHFGDVSVSSTHFESGPGAASSMTTTRALNTQACGTAANIIVDGSTTCGDGSSPRTGGASSATSATAAGVSAVSSAGSSSGSSNWAPVVATAAPMGALAAGGMVAALLL